MKKNKLLFLIFAGIFAAGILPACKKSLESDKKSEQKIQKYHCPMHTNYISDKPGNCPICGMKLVPMVDHSKEKSVASGDQSAVQITAERQQLIGVKTQKVQMRNLNKTIRAAAKVAYDPELYNAIAEYRQALQSKEKIKESSWPGAQERADALLQASSIKLHQMGFSETQIENLTDEDYKNFLVPEKNSFVWVYAQIYESEMQLARIGQKVEVSAPSVPGKKFWGEIHSIDPVLNNETRTLKVRVKVENTDGGLHPQMIVNAKIYVDLGRKLCVAQTAILRSGERTLVFIAENEGKYIPKQVRLGDETEDYAEILSGVSEDEKVVTSANFLIDSESKLQTAAEAMSEHKH